MRRSFRTHGSCAWNPGRCLVCGARFGALACDGRWAGVRRPVGGWCATARWGLVCDGPLGAGVRRPVGGWCATARWGLVCDGPLGAGVRQLVGGWKHGRWYGTARWGLLRICAGMERPVARGRRERPARRCGQRDVLLGEEGEFGVECNRGDAQARSRVWP